MLQVTFLLPQKSMVAESQTSGGRSGLGPKRKKDEVQWVTFQAALGFQMVQGPKIFSWRLTSFTLALSLSWTTLSRLPQDSRSWSPRNGKGWNTSLKRLKNRVRMRCVTSSLSCPVKTLMAFFSSSVGVDTIWSSGRLGRPQKVHGKTW